jgi:DNA-binding transcriptional ArsR family regulator
MFMRSVAVLAFAALAFGADYSDISERSDAELKALHLRPDNVRPLAPPLEEATGFRIGGTNPTDLLQRLPSINGVTIDQLEATMRPGVLSDAGFLGPDESLLDVLVLDNDTVLGAGQSHRAIGFHLRILGELGIVPEREDFSYRGERFRVERADTHGAQESPFNDGLRDGRNATVTNLRSGASIAYALLVPRLIERYGFYEGFGTPYRVDPKRAIDVLGAALRDNTRCDPARTRPPAHDGGRDECASETTPSRARRSDPANYREMPPKLGASTGDTSRQ